jgi:pimeloyl-ACP methyl ester carboxylesterase
MGRKSVVALVGALLLRGGVDAPAQSSARSAPPAPPGRLIDIGGYLLHLYCMGQGSPTVVLLHGFGDYSFDWSLVQPAVAQTTRVCAYDRAGQAWSDPGPPPRGLQRISDELHTLLARAGEKGPFVLVGHSWGGLIPRVYVRQHRTDVAGVVFVDASHEDMWMWLNGVTLQPRLASPEEWERIHRPRARSGPPVSPDSSGGPPRAVPSASAISPVSPASTATDTSRPHLEPPYNALPLEVQRWHAWARSLPPAFTGGDWADIRADLILTYESRAGDRRPFGSLPTLVLSAGRDSFEDEKEASAAEQRAQHDRGQADLATLSTNSRHVVATNSGHHIHLDEPDLVVEAIRQVVDAARTRRPLCRQR